MSLSRTYHWECPGCGEELEIEIDVGEHFRETPDACDFCGRELTDAEKHEIDMKAEIP